LVFITTEVAPWSKVGGLADVLAALPAALAARGHAVMTVAPYYEEYAGAEDAGCPAVPLRLPAALAPLPAADAAEGAAAAVTAAPRRRPRGRRRREDAARAAADADAAADDDDDAGAAGCSCTSSSAGAADAPPPPPPAEARLRRLVRGGVDRVFVDHPLLRTRDIYGFSGGGPPLTYMEAGDAAALDVRYSVLCQAALAAPALLWPPPLDSAGVVFVANDWPAAPALLRLRHALRAPAGAAGGCAAAAPPALAALDALLQRRLASAAAALCIHNLAYQGLFPAAAFSRLCLPRAALPALCDGADWAAVLAADAAREASGGAAAAEAEEDLGCAPAPGVDAPRLNFMRAAVLAADAVLTVAPGYAREIATDAGGMGCGLAAPLAARAVAGVMNGLDVAEWDPATDAHLPAALRYDAASFAAGKAAAKAALQRELRLAVDPAAPLVVFVGRLTAQKGVDVLLSAASAVMPPPRPPRGAPGSSDGGGADDDAGAPGALQLVLLGTGEAWMEAAAGGLAAAFPGRAAGVTRFSERLAHALLAAADYCLVPSRFEPCGLVAQAAARYGAVPIVTAVGGLKDLVSPALGLTLPPFSGGAAAGGDRAAAAAAHAADAARLAAVLRLAAAECGGPRHRARQAACMALDLSWDAPAAEWERHLGVLARLRAPATRRAAAAAAAAAASDAGDGAERRAPAASSVDE
jgi:granule-bound starch synthase